MAVLLLTGTGTANSTTAPSSSGGREMTAQDAYEATIPADPAELLLSAMGAKRLVLVGEMHGTRETPHLIGQLLQRLAARGEALLLALEIARQEQPDIDRYLDSSGDATAQARLLSARHWQDASHDGRDSQAMLQLIELVRVMRKTHARVELVLVDDLGGFKPDGNRDELMARHLRAAIARNSGARVLFLAGNLHARVRPPLQKMFDRDGREIEPRRSAGQHLSDLEPWSVRIDGAQGNAWFCGYEGCGVNPLLDRGARTSASLERLGTREGWDAQLLLPRFTASPPAVSAVEAAK